MDEASTPWWGMFEVPHGRSRRWHIGPLQLTISRLAHEWWLARVAGNDPFQVTSEVEAPTELAATDPKATQLRYAVSDEHETILLLPIMPDRSVVTRPEHPVIVPAGQEVTLFVGSPVWLRLEATTGHAPPASPSPGGARAAGPPATGTPAQAVAAARDPAARMPAQAGTPLGEFAAHQPSDTWWGPNTREGEICYATFTYGRLRIDDANFYPHRVMTAVRVDNDAREPLAIERLNLPVRGLGVYADLEARLWTEAVTLHRADTKETAELEVSAAPPSEARDPVKLSPPRTPFKDNLLFRAFSSLFR